MVEPVIGWLCWKLKTAPFWPFCPTQNYVVLRKPISFLTQKTLPLTRLSSNQSLSVSHSQRQRPFLFLFSKFFFPSASDFGASLPLLWTSVVGGRTSVLCLSPPSLFSRLLRVTFLDISFDGNICSCMLKFLITRDFKGFIYFIEFFFF